MYVIVSIICFFKFATFIALGTELQQSQNAPYDTAIPMPTFIQSYWLRLLAVITCPVLAIIGVLSFTIGVFADLPALGRIGTAAFSFAMIMLMPLGITCGLLSWQMARNKTEAATDSRDFVEFLLGFAGFVMIVLGAILSPVTYWLAAQL